MTTGHHTDDDFAYSQRLLDEQRGKPRLTGTATATVTPAVHHFGEQTKAAIASTVDPIGPSDFYIANKPLMMGRVELQQEMNKCASDALTRLSDFATRPGAVIAQVGGTHYGDPKTDVYAFAMANGLDAMQFNVVKYVTRFRKKDGIKDLRKAMQTLERLIAHEEGRA